MVKAILYDLDGVLANFCSTHYHSLNYALISVCQFEISLEDHNSVYNGLPTKVKLQMLKDKGLITNEDIPKIWQLKQDITLNIIEKNAEIDHEKIELHEFTKSLGIKSACVTNSIRKTAILALEKTGQLPYLEFIIANEDAPPKPSPQPYLLAMEKMTIKPNECFIIEDSDKGIESAKLSGSKVIKIENYQMLNKKLIEKVLHA